jgi:hypothetical protein
MYGVQGLAYGGGWPERMLLSATGAGAGAAIVLLVLTLALAAGLAVFANALELFDRRVYLPALLLPMFLAVAFAQRWLDGAMLSIPLVLWAHYRAASATGNSQVYGAFFEAGLLVGVAAFIWLPAGFFVVSIIAAMNVSRAFDWREQVLVFFGLGVVLWLTMGVGALLDTALWSWGSVLRPHAWAMPAPGKVYITALAVLVLPWLLLATRTAINLDKRSIMRQRNARASFFAFTMACGALIGAEMVLNGAFPPVLAAVPLAVWCSYALVHVRRAWLAEVVVMALWALGLWAQWYMPANFAIP